MDARRGGGEKREKRMGPDYDNSGNDISGGWPRRDVDSGGRGTVIGRQQGVSSH